MSVSKKKLFELYTQFHNVLQGGGGSMGQGTPTSCTLQEAALAWGECLLYVACKAHKTEHQVQMVRANPCNKVAQP